MQPGKTNQHIYTQALRRLYLDPVIASYDHQVRVCGSKNHARQLLSLI